MAFCKHQVSVLLSNLVFWIFYCEASCSLKKCTQSDPWESGLLLSTQKTALWSWSLTEWRCLLGCHLGSNISCLCLRLPNNDLNKIDWCAKVKQTKTNNNTKHIMINTHFPSLQVWRINLSKQNEIKQNPCNPKTPCPSPESRVNKCFW